MSRMDVKVSIKNMKGTLDAIASKSDAHRVLIAAALSDGKCKLLLNSTSNDIKATASCLTAAGAAIEYDGMNMTVSPVKTPAASAVFDCGESGSTIRFMIPVAAALGIDSVFTGSGRLPERPQTALLKVLGKNGVTVSKDGEFPIKISGRLKSGVFELPGNISSQYITGLLFALPLLEGDSEIRLTTPLESRPYVDMTLHTLTRFGIEINEKDNSFFVKGRQKYKSPSELVIDGDWSNGAFFVAAGALSDIKINGLYSSSVQGDKKCAEIIRAMGADITAEDGVVHIKKNRLRGVDINASDTPDLVPVLAALACFAEGTTTITGAERLRIKESDRLKTVTELIKTAGGDVKELPDGLIINGGKKLKDKFTVSSFNDHRLVMAAAVLSFGSEVTITNAETINKTYPAFFEDIAKIGGDHIVVNNG